MGVIIKSSLLLVLFVVLWEIEESSALSCLPCNKRTCKTPKYCKGGLVKDVCNCCYVCAKVKGETCGGPFQIAGKCAKGLTCRKTPKPGQILFNLRGICSCGPVCRIYCRYGNVHNRFGCPTCRCHKYPRCRRYPYSPYHHGGRRSYPFWHCRRHETVFCKRDCKTCCRHSTTCAPNHWYTRKQRYCHIYRH
ncbi:serine protease HTRA1B-like isoform X2 [Hydractinia symbiolongicarpus]|uniref:serine protease HTRA1B-like isoform X2 n=1 Tax=Hydractinia symbiolongicarpus TaxID=13093 RepID=UPI0025518618|nr:serine protease HTRA1B-like isoform X2 [Hydractinia symbiolongicarpus]